MICRIFLFLSAICLLSTPTDHEKELFLSIEAIGNTQNVRLQDNSSIENIIRAHLRPDSPPIQDDIHINYHHLKRLTELSIYQQTFKNFLIFRGSDLSSLRMYDCQVKDFNSIAFLLGIKELYIQNCLIENISSLAKLRGLTYLSLTNNNIKDISALSHCLELTWLDLRNNMIDNVSALRHLKKLVYVDLRNNPLGANSNNGDVQLIKVNNPGVRILLGKQFGMSQADLEQLLSAKAKIAEFALCARLQYKDGIGLPLLPNVSDEIIEALKCLGKGNDKEYLTGIAALLMKYVIEIETYYRPGPVLGRGEEPILDSFLDGVDLKVGDEGIAALTIADWICNNRDKLAPSLFLDRQIERRRDLHSELKRKGIYGNN